MNHHRCVVALTHYRRGHTGIAIIWKDYIDQFIELNEGEGCSRNIFISLNCTPRSIALISSYLPAGNTPDEIATYEMVLDEVYQLIVKYSGTTKVIWAGDINGSLSVKRHKRDQLLQEFCNEVGLQSEGELETPTFHHNANSSTSRMDYSLQLGTQENQISPMYIQSRQPTK